MVHFYPVCSHLDYAFHYWLSRQLFQRRLWGYKSSNRWSNLPNLLLLRHNSTDFLNRVWNLVLRAPSWYFPGKRFWNWISCSRLINDPSIWDDGWGMSGDDQNFLRQWDSRWGSHFILMPWSSFLWQEQIVTPSRDRRGRWTVWQEGGILQVVAWREALQN